MYRTWIIAKHTFLEAITQPIYALLLSIGSGILLIFALLPFFTLGEDTVMYKAVGLDVIMLIVLITTLFATSKSIHEEIEDRTMLTLMSKPVSRLQVLAGKYFGLCLASLLGIVVMGVILLACTSFRVPGDYFINNRSIDEREINNLANIRWSHNSGLIPCLLLTWFQVSVLAAISVAISTRFSLVVNLPVVILIYIAGNLTRFLGASTGPLHYLSDTFASILPFLEVFDLRRYTVYAQLGMTGSNASSQNSFSPVFVWKNTGLAGLYSLCYITFAMSLGLLSFRNRELGGSEG